MPDYMFLLESRLSPEQRAVMMRVQELSASMGFNLYLTGGTVRDLITGASLRDLDFTVEGNPSKIARELEKGGAKILSEDEKLPDIERGEVRALTIHSFTNQPVRLLRVLRFAARMGFKLEQRTQEWFDLAIERDLHKSIAPEDAGGELRALAREERPTVVLKAWEQHDLLEAVNPNLAKRHPDYDAITKLMKVREDLFTAGFRPRLATPMLLAILGRLKDRELGGVLSKAGYRSADAGTLLGFPEEALEAQKELAGRKMKAPIDAYRFIEKRPLDQVAYLLAESRNSVALSKIRAYLNKWRPIRIALPGVANELEALGMARGPKFDDIVEQVFAIQLTGRGKTPEEREKILRKLSGIKEAPKKKEKKGAKGAEKVHAVAAAGKHTDVSSAAAKAAKKAHHRERLSAGKQGRKAAPPSRGKSAAGTKKSGGRK